MIPKPKAVKSEKVRLEKQKNNIYFFKAVNLFPKERSELIINFVWRLPKSFEWN